MCLIPRYTNLLPSKLLAHSCLVPTRYGRSFLFSPLPPVWKCLILPGSRQPVPLLIFLEQRPCNNQPLCARIPTVVAVEATPAVTYVPFCIDCPFRKVCKS